MLFSNLSSTIITSSYRLKTKGFLSDFSKAKTLNYLPGLWVMNSVPILSWPLWSYLSVADQRHSFRLTSSFDQRLALVVLASVCLCSFLAWPRLDNLIYLMIKYCAAGVTLVFFSYQFWQLSYWHCRFSLGRDGEGQIAWGVKRRLASVDETSMEKFTLVMNPIVTPLVVFFYVHTQDMSVGHRRLVIVWADMLDDTSYRHLCRLLLAN